MNSCCERARHGVGRAVERLLEAETGLDADHEEVEHVGELPADLPLTIGDAAVEHRVGSEHEEQRHEADDRKSHEALDRSELVDQEDRDRDRRDRHHAHREEPVDVVVAVRAKGRELLAHVLEVALRREPATDGREARRPGE